MAASDPQPDSVEWTLTTPQKAMRLDPGTNWLNMFSKATWRVFVVVVNGDFTIADDVSPPQHADALLFVLDRTHGYLGQYQRHGAYGLSGLGGVHTY